MTTPPSLTVRWSIAAFLLLIALPVAATLVTGAIYWGHWLGPPSSAGTVALLSRVDRFTTFWDVSPPKSGPRALAEAAKRENYIWGEQPLGRLPAQMLREGLTPRTSEPIAEITTDDVRGALERSGLLVHGVPGYSEGARTLGGHMIAGRDRSGATIYVVALTSGQFDNDRYAYYEGAFDVGPDGKLSVRTLRRYWYDVAGLEGFAHLAAGVAAAFLGAMLLGISFVVALWMQRARSGI